LFAYFVFQSSWFTDDVFFCRGLTNKKGGEVLASFFLLFCASSPLTVFLSFSRYLVMNPQLHSRKVQSHSPHRLLPLDLSLSLSSFKSPHTPHTVVTGFQRLNRHFHVCTLFWLRTSSGSIFLFVLCSWTVSRDAPITFFYRCLLFLFPHLIFFASVFIHERTLISCTSRVLY